MKNKHIKFQPHINPLPTLSTQSFLAELDKLEGVRIEKTFINGCSGQNQVNVFPADKNGVPTSEEPLFTAVEQSNQCSRMFCQNDCRQYKLNFYKTASSSDANGKSMKREMEISIKKDYSCVCFCNSNKSLIEVYTDKLVGYVLSPNYCYGKGVEVFDEKSSLIYSIRAPCCQTSNFCYSSPTACSQGCTELLFDVKNAHGDVISQIKKFDQYDKFCGNVPTYFSIPFPPGATSEIKALFIAAAVAIDYKYFSSYQLYTFGNRFSGLH